MSLVARFSGTCPECGGRWQPGDLIRSEAAYDDGIPIWQHATCPDEELDALVAAHSPCERCFLVHPEGACDR